MTIDAKETELSRLASRIRACTKCELHRGRTKGVPGSGPAHADVVFLGEGPGAREDELGLPFVGRSGKYLDQLLMSVRLHRDEVFITNVVKCRPPSNRNPRVAELEACIPYLEQQLELIQPRLVVTLGRFAMEHFLPEGRISEIHGQPRQIEDTIYLPLYHPAAALYRASLRSVVEDDFQKIRMLLDQPQVVP